MAKNYRPIPIPDGVQLTVKSGQLDVKGKLGALSVSVIPRLEVKSDGKEVSVAAGTGVPSEYSHTVSSCAPSTRVCSARLGPRCGAGSLRWA